MSRKFEKYQKKRLRTSYISVVVSIALVLFILGLFGFIVLKTNTLGAHFKEQISMNLFFKEEVSQEDTQVFLKEINELSFVKNTSFTTKDEAAEMMKEDMGEDFLEILGTNPLRDRIDIRFHSDFVTVSRIDSIQQVFKKSPMVYEVEYDKSLIEKLNENLSRMSFWVLVFSGIFTLITVMLINSTIRLSIYSKRFTIKTMQMVGATKAFIRRPFIWLGVKLGIISAFIATAALAGLGYYVEQKIPGFSIQENYIDFLIVFGGLVLLGILITWISTYLATRRFLNLRTEELYY
jgi:cell division transport system permease protein